MKINNAEVIVGCDVDGTLIKRINFYPAFEEIIIKNPYDGKDYGYIIHHEHVELLRQYKGRGFYIKVWSANGVLHAKSVVKALGLDDGTVDEVCTKCAKVLDDKKNLADIVGNRIFIPREGFTYEL